MPAATAPPLTVNDDNDNRDRDRQPSQHGGHSVATIVQLGPDLEQQDDGRQYAPGDRGPALAAHQRHREHHQGAVSSVVRSGDPSALGDVSAAEPR